MIMTPQKFLDGQILIAMPGMGDPRFDKSLIFLCAHSENGAMGIMVNKTAPMMFFSDLVDQLKIVPNGEMRELSASVLNLPVLFGGPVEQFRGFVLHSTDYFTQNTSLPINNGVALTATVEILEAIARGAGPSKVTLALGYSGWVAGQLENEMQHNGWLFCEADDDLLFGKDNDGKYNRALRKIGVDPLMLSSDSGHA
jgi:putative transcriptional regulator